MKKYGSIWLERAHAEKLRTFLKENNIPYEPSEDGNGIYFCGIPMEEAERINKYLDEEVWGKEAEK